MDRDPIDRDPMDREARVRENEELPSPNPEGQEDHAQGRAAVGEASLAVGYELADARVRPIVIFAVSLLIAAAIAHLILFFVLRTWTGRPLPFVPRIPPAVVSLPQVPGPGLDAAPESELQQLYNIENERLSTYGWIDRDAGRVRIPISRAMELIAASGGAAQEGMAPSFGLDPAFRMDSAGGVRPAGGESDAAAAGAAPQEGTGGEGTSGGSATDDIVTEEGAAPQGGAEEEPSELRNNGDSTTGGASTEEGSIEERDDDD